MFRLISDHPLAYLVLLIVLAPVSFGVGWVAGRVHMVLRGY